MCSGLEDRIRELCAQATVARPDELETVLSELKSTLQEHTERLRKMAVTKLTWQVLYEDAVLESDKAKLSEKILQTRSAIQDRAQEILSDLAERDRLDNALRILDILEKTAA